MNTGRPPTYNTAEELNTKAIEYFKQFTKGYEGEIALNEKKPTITGLVLYLGFCDRSAFYKYEEKEEFRHTIKRLRSLIENIYEGRLCESNVAGAIFALKNFSWVDKTEVKQSGSLDVNMMGTVTIGGKPIKIET